VATGAQAVERVAKATRRLPSAVLRTARALREADPALWPQAGKGGGKSAAHVEPPHLANLVFALAAADVIAAAPKVAIGYGGMRWNAPRRSPPDRTGDATVKLQGAGLLRDDITGRGLVAGLIELLARDTDAVRVLPKANCQIVLEKDPSMPRMALDYMDLNILDDGDYDQKHFILRPPDTPITLSRTQDPTWNFLADLPDALYMLETKRLLMPLLILLGELWEDTRRHHMPIILPVSASASANPEYETAADSLPGAAAVRLNQPHTEGERPGRQTPRKLGERERLSKQSVAALPEE
jgi:hypothetical protein